MRPYRAAMHEAATAYVRDVLRAASGNVSLAARTAGVNRKHLYKMMHRFGVSVDDVIEGPRDRGLQIGKQARTSH